MRGKRYSDAAVEGEYARVSDWTTKPIELEKAFFTPLTESEAELLIHAYQPKTDVVFYPDIRSSAVDSGGHTLIRLTNNPLTPEDIEKRINYPRLTLGVVIHELAHINAGVAWGHSRRFVEALDDLIDATSDSKWKKIVADQQQKEIENKEKKKPAKSIAQIFQELCPTCKKQAKIKSQFEDEKFIYYQLECDHLLMKEKEKSAAHAVESFQSVNGEKLYRFQKENVLKFQEANGKLAILDEMGLGKTPSSIAIAHLYEKFPTVVVCKSGLRHQWKKMTEYWGNVEDDLGLGHVKSQVIENSKDFLIANMHFYIVSYDLLPLLPSTFFKKAKTLQGKEVPVDIKMVIIDECQHIKNPEAQRTRAVFELCKDVPNYVFLSGTPIKNSAIEFYPMVHMLDPIRFRNRSQYAAEFVDTYMKGPYIKYGGLKNYEKFKETTEKFFIRHTQAEVLPDLPEITRNFVYTDLGDSDSEYNEIAKQFADYYYSTAKEDRQFFQNVLSFFTKMRHITGLAKVQEAVDYAIDFLESTERKLAIFTHHIDVREMVVEKINEYLKEKGLPPALELVGSMDGEAKEKLKDKFNFDPSYRILVASTLASGEGHNLQHACSDALMLERQWNPANEEQAEFRFKRPGQKANAINVTYLIALETIDEYFTKLVEQKRMVVKNSLDGTKIAWDQNAILMELAQVIAGKSNQQILKKRKK